MVRPWFLSSLLTSDGCSTFECYFHLSFFVNSCDVVLTSELMGNPLGWSFS